MKEFINTNDLFEHFQGEVKKITLVGMIKQDDDDKLIMYSPAGCDTWIGIEKASVLNVYYLGQAPCKKNGEEPHVHPFVRLNIQESTVSNPVHLRAIAALSNRLSVRLKKDKKMHRENMMRPSGECNADGAASGWTACGGSATCDGEVITADPDQRVFWDSESCWVESCPECQ